MNGIINLFTYIGVGVVIGLIVGFVISVVDEGTHAVVTGMIVGAVTGIAILFLPKPGRRPEL